MYPFPIGVLLESFRLPREEAIRKCAELGLQGFQLYCTTPEKYTPEMRAELRAQTAANGLVIASICSDNGKGFTHPEINDAQIEMTCRALDMAKEVGLGVVTSHIGKIPADRSEPVYGILMDACGRIGEYGRSIGAKMAIETGPETSDILRDFLEELNSPAIGVNLDPANLRMCCNEDAVPAVRNLGKFIFHTHAKDGVNLSMTPTVTYREVPLGEGTVGFPSYLAALEEVGYRGFLTIERECGEDRVKDITTAADYLKSLTR